MDEMHLYRFMDKIHMKYELCISIDVLLDANVYL